MRTTIPAVLGLLLLNAPSAPAQSARGLAIGFAPERSRPAAASYAPLRRADDHRWEGAIVGAGLYGVGLIGFFALADAIGDDGVGNVNVPLFVAIGAGVTLVGGLIGSAIPKGK